jgi:hypothetical protein
MASIETKMGNIKQEDKEQKSLIKTLIKEFFWNIQLSIHKYEHIYLS